MAEETLNVKVKPEIDDESIQDLTQKLSDVVVNATGVISGGGSESSAGGTEDQTTKEQAIENSAEGVARGLEKSSKAPETLGRLTAPLTKNQESALRLTSSMDATAKEGNANAKEQTSVFGKISEGLAMGVGFAIAGWGIVKKLFQIVSSSAGPLNDILNLFNTIFGLFLLPLNIALTQILIPYVQELASSMGTFVSEMMEVYQKDGLGGIIVATFGKLVSIFLPMLIKMVEYTGTVILTVLKQIWNSGNLAKAVITLAITIPAFLLVFKIWTGVMQVLQYAQDAKLTMILTDFFTTNAMGLIRTTTLVSIAIPILAIAAGILIIVGLLNAISGGSIFGFAEGGVFEPNNEKIIKVGDNKTEQEIVAPKSTIVSAVNEALDSNTSITNSSSNVGQSVVVNATFNITSNDPEAVAKEVEKQLSKMMDATYTRWGV